ncbi:MAG: transporter substrate-binding domain-containing protein [Kiloniellales bacterium]|nr:transporter substrate-binding domain-containing protein [Kiloniellales bacterium]
MRGGALACAIALVCLLAPTDAALARCEDHVPGPKPQNASRDIVGQSLDEIVERGYIEFAVYEEFPPYSWRDGGKAKGVDIDLGRLVAEFLGVEARFRFVAAAENVDGDLRNYVWKGPLIGGRVSNIMLHVPYNDDLACRNEQVVLTGQYFNEKIAIAYRRDAYPDGDAPTPAYFRFDKVGVENDSIADFYLSSFAGGQLQPNIRRFPTTAEAMVALAQGEVQAVMGRKTQLDFGLTAELAVHAPPLPGFAVGEWTLGVAVRHNYRPLAYSVDDAIRAAVDDGRLAAIFDAHGLSFTPPDW